MKKILVSALLLTSLNAANAQKIELGVQGGFGSTWLLNSNVFDQGDNLDPVSSFGPIFGLQGELHLPVKLSLVVGLNYAMVHQKYTSKMTIGGSTSTVDATDKLNYFEIPIVVRKYTGPFMFVELGPKLSFLTGAKESTSGGLVNASDRTVTDGYKKVVVSAVLGVGAKFPVAPHIHVNAGLRLAYGFTDATQKLSETELNNKAAAGTISVGTYYAHQAQNGDFSYKSSHLATGYVVVGASYTLH